MERKLGLVINDTIEEFQHQDRLGMTGVQYEAWCHQLISMLTMAQNKIAIYEGDKILNDN